MRPATSARGRTATTSTDTAAHLLAALRDGELEVIGRLIGSSNNAMVVRIWPAVTENTTAGDAPTSAPALHPGFGKALEPDDLLGVWKPTAGERPLFDFPLGTLTRREVASYLVSEATGWAIVPPTLLRDGPYGEGMLQQWIDVDPEADVIAMVNDDDPRLRRIAVLDAVLNNTDRKAGHLLPVPGGHLHAVDHGVTFSEEPKLRTVLWAWEGEPFDPEEVAALAGVATALGSRSAPGPLAITLGELLAAPEIEATRARITALLDAGVFPSPSPDWPAIPWPPV
ncbi:MAG TPA: SCO1664 family protein [Candidatus Limnocylindria bacterium]|nr:SCO1664 family protein [Candidatus Limnocylindria bacterium]